MKIHKLLIVKATTACNLNCPYCYNYKNSHCRQDISEETVDKILSVFDNKISAFVWHGGEPLLVGKEFFDKTNEKIMRTNPFADIDLQTNGTLIDEEFISLFKKYKVNVGVSYDGLYNSKTRKNDEKLFKVFDLLKKNDINFGCLLVFTNETIPSLIDEYEFAKKNGLKISVNPVFRANGNDQSYNLDSNTMIEKTCEFFDYWMYDKTDPQPAPYLEKYIKLLLGAKEHICEHGFCAGCWLSISPNGDIYPCGRDWNEDFRFCNIHEIDKEEDIYETENFKKFLEISKKLTYLCIDKKCPFFTMCAGGCYARHINWIKERGKFEVEPNYCHSQKAILTYIFNKVKNISLYDYKKYNPRLIDILIKNRYTPIR